MRSSVTMRDFMSEIRHEIDQVKKSKEFPNRLIFKWTHKAICEAQLRLGGLINQLYRTTGTVAIIGNAGHYDASVDHTASSTTISGFTDLTIDAWIGGSALAVVDSVFYAAQITDNTATTVTISVGTDLPAITTGPMFLTKNNSSASASISGLSMVNYAEPIWQVLDGSGNPIELMSTNEARNIKNDPMYEDEAYYQIQGQTIQLALGSSKTLSGNLTVGYYELATEATALTDYIDFPQEWHDLVQQKVMIRVYEKLNNIKAAREKEIALEKQWKELEASNINAAAIDRQTGERK